MKTRNVKLSVGETVELTHDSGAWKVEAKVVALVGSEVELQVTTYLGSEEVAVREKELQRVATA